MPDQGNEESGMWYDWLNAYILFQEADTLLHKRSVEPNSNALSIQSVSAILTESSSALSVFCELHPAAKEMPARPYRHDRIP